MCFGPAPWSLRRLVALIRNLPPEAAVNARRADGGWWARGDEMMATLLEVCHATMRGVWLSAGAKSVPKQLRWPRPDSVTAPERNVTVVTSVRGSSMRQAMESLRAS